MAAAVVLFALSLSRIIIITSILSSIKKDLSVILLQQMRHPYRIVDDNTGRRQPPERLKHRID
jgi:hypothetical protein